MDFGKNVSFIGVKAFSGCGSLRSLVFRGANAPNVAVDQHTGAPSSFDGVAEGCTVYVSAKAKGWPTDKQWQGMPLVPGDCMVKVNVDVYDGGGKYGTVSGGGDDGQLTLTVAATGKISGKYIGVDGKTWTLSAANFYELDESTPLYSAELLAKSGKETAAFTLEIGVNEKMEGCGIAEIRDEKDAILGNLYQTNWKADPWKGIAGKIAKAAAFEYPAFDEAGNPGMVTLKFAASGKVTAKGTFGSNSVSCSTVVVPTTNPDSNESFGFCIYVCLPQKGKFAGYCGTTPLSIWTGTSFK